MTQGNIFSLMLNSGREDQYITAFDKINERLAEIYKDKLDRCFLKWNKYFNNPDNLQTAEARAQYTEWVRDPREFCNNQVAPIQSTMNDLDKTHNTYIGKMWKPMIPLAFSYIKCSEKKGETNFDTSIRFQIQPLGTWFHEMVLHLRLSDLKAIDSRDKVKYCEKPGHRIIKNVRFIVNNVVLAEYSTEYYNKYYAFDVSGEKRAGWLRNMGQEIPRLAYMTPDPANNEYREYRLFGDGPQTLKREQPDLDLFIPILFQFNTELTQAFPQCKIPNGLIEVEVEFAPRKLIYAIADYGGGGAATPPKISLCELYVQHITTVPEVQNIILKDYNFSLIRVPKIHEEIVEAPNQEIYLNNIKYPVEQLAICFRPMENYTDVDYWNNNNKLLPVNIYVPAAVLDSNSQPTLAIQQAFYNSEAPVINKLRLHAKDIDIFAEMNVKMYSSYLPMASKQTYTPDDQGWLLMPMNFFAHSTDPSGHINFAKTKDLRIAYSSDIINTSYKAKATIIAQTYNFLIVQRYNAMLKFT